MAKIKYFSDITGEAVELPAPYGMPNKEFAARWPGVSGIRYDGYSMWVGRQDGKHDGAIMPVTRKIEYKSQPSRHECDARCMNGSLRGACECRCGGANHGRGLFTNFLKAA